MSEKLVRRMAQLGGEDSSDSVFSSSSSKKRFSLGLNFSEGQSVSTGIVYDEEMLSHENEVNQGHPECPQRISSIWKELVKEGVVDCCKRIEARKATEEEIMLVHKKTHYDFMMSTESMAIEKLFYHSLQYSSIYMNKSSLSCALLSAGSVCEVTKKVILGDLDNALAIVRPPGHHAEAYKPMGFCFFNNVAIAAKMAIETFNMNRVLIVDWDVHHGNGTQNMFYDDKRVLYVSLHRYDNGGFFPASNDADFVKSGSGKGEGFNINIPWNDMKMGDAEYIAAFHQIILPIAYEYNPEIVLVSCGFDAGVGDPLGGYNVTPTCYGHMTHKLKSLANGKLVVVLEGGYNLTTISQSMCNVAEVMLGDTPRTLVGACVANQSAMTTIKNVCVHMSSYWKSMSHWKSATNGTCTVDVPQTEAPVTEDTIDDNDPVTPVVLSTDDSGTANITFGRTEGSSDPITRPETPPTSSIPLPSERMPLSVAQKTIVDALEDEGNVCMFAVSPKAWCQHLESLVPLPSDVVLDTKVLCEVCQTPRENWVCLSCHKVLCGRYINQHMVQHSEETGHSIALSFADLSVWCFPCDSYVHNPVLFPYINKAHVNKFGPS